MTPPDHERDDRAFYLDLPGESFLGRLARRARTGVYEIFLRELAPGAATTVLDVGVSVVKDEPPESNMLEQLYPHRSNLTMLGIHEGAFLERRYPGTRYVRYDGSTGFPFADGQFDVCYCNAVIEHIGNEEDRRRFLRELLRVGRRLFLTTPNRWYPVDLHTMLPFLHWLPQDWYRAILAMSGETFYSRKENLDLLSRRTLDRLLRETGVPYRIVPYRFMGLVSNLLAITG
jgi:SAM-dependent methyltransferase